MILLQRRWHWWRFALASLACDRRGAGRDRPRGGPAPAHLRAPALLAVRGPPLRLRPTRHPRSPSASSSGTWSPPRCGWPSRSGCWPPRCRCGTPSGPPAGPSGAPSSAAASASTSAPATARPPGWSPGPATTSSPRPPSGIALDGDLAQLAPGPLRRPAGAAARQGHGRGRRPRAPARPSPCSAWPTWPGVLGRKVCFVDCKGTDPTLVPALIAAYRLGNPTARVGCWPRHGDGHVARLTRSRWPAACWPSSSSPSRSTSGSPPPASAWP